jgi:hypothetical protein
MKDYVTYAPMAVWLYNYDYNFIELVWGHDPYMMNHLKTKWEDYIEMRPTTANAMLSFYANLDGENQRLLDAHIYRKYKHYHEYAGEIISQSTPTE